MASTRSRTAASVFSLAGMIDAALDFLPPGARVLKDRIEVQSLGIFDRIMTCPIDLGQDN